jgi:hypothetical protein
VDAERAFSGGRLQVGHLQHATSSQTFKARVALASWINTPFLPPGTPASMIAEASRKSKAGKSNRKGKGKEVVVVDIPSDSATDDNDFDFYVTDVEIGDDSPPQTDGLHPDT